MGGTKSKPLVESARKVLAKRSMPQESEILKSATSKAPVPDLNFKIDVKYNENGESRTSTNPKRVDPTEIDKDILSEISKWSKVQHTTKDAQVCYQQLYKIFTACVVLTPQSCLLPNSDWTRIHCQFVAVALLRNLQSRRWRLQRRRSLRPRFDWKKSRRSTPSRL